MFGGDTSAYGKRLAVGVLSLIIVEIEIIVGHHNGVMALTHGLTAAILAAPRHHCGVRA